VPRFDTSFNFGANKPKKAPAKPKAPKGAKAKSRSYFGAMHGS
jgi:hypothetical protein